MNDVVNLNKFRKRKKAEEKDSKAAENRVKFGRTKAEKALDDKNRRALERQVDSHRREDQD